MSLYRNKFVFKPQYQGLWDESRPDFHVASHRRTGKNWNDAECRHLLAGYQMEGLSIPKLAQRHQRGVAGISAQLSRIMEDSPKVLRLYTQLRENELLVRSPQDALSDRLAAKLSNKASLQDRLRDAMLSVPTTAEEKEALLRSFSFKGWSTVRVHLGNTEEPSLAGRARAYADQMMNKRTQPCTGTACGSTDPRFHSRECYAQHDAATSTTDADLLQQASWPAHNEAIARAFLDGRKVEYLSHRKKKWVVFHQYGYRGAMKAGDPKREWRLYVPPRVVTLGATVREANGALVLVHAELPDANLVLEFTDGALTKAAVNDFPG